MKQTPFSLDLIQIASPCHEPWEQMRGDEQVRFCRHCKLNVYNLSEMSRKEAEAFIQNREGRKCIRFFRRQDGTVLTKDCPVGVRALRQRFVRAVAALAGVLMALIGSTLLGGGFQRLRPSGLRSPLQAFSQWINPQPPVHLMGEIFEMGGCPPPPTICRPPPAGPAPGAVPTAPPQQP